MAKNGILINNSDDGFELKISCNSIDFRFKTTQSFSKAFFTINNAILVANIVCVCSIGKYWLLPIIPFIPEAVLYGIMVV